MALLHSALSCLQGPAAGGPQSVARVLLPHPPPPPTPCTPPLTPQARIEQAEAGGCPEGLVSDAKRQLHRLLLAEVKGELEAGAYIAGRWQGWGGLQWRSLPCVCVEAQR